ncbi:hypothetical protein [Pedobacter hiemivivus]|uniref:Uncharacterized protein n=1 Tax=Pedobacter hiemivivus TaxID=2530454 RepID=A0A4R0NAP8_9SPHI|nr:hypothetical protein [Pedobacter hiemivivus]TCC97205.1 hypothetical protein EZ444_10165 [Pedobacter hiemivivus]
MRIIFTLLALLLFNVTFAQHPYYDALKLRKYISDDKIFAPADSLEMDTLVSIFKLYNYSGTINPFLTPFTSEGKGYSADDVKKATLNLSSIIGSVAGVDVTTIANGVAMLMIDRAKQELTVTFFNRFKKFAEDNPEFKVLFPKTTDNLKNLLAYKYPEMLPALRTGFYADLNKITYNLDDVLELPRYNELLKKFPEIKITIRSIRLVHELESGESHAAEIITKFADFEEWKTPGTSNGFKNFKSSVKLAAIFSNSLRHMPDPVKKEKDVKAWISIKQIRELVKDTITFRIYLGLVYQLAVMDDITWYKTTDKPLKTESISFATLMGKQKDNLFLFENKLTKFIELSETVDKLTDTLNYKKDEKIALKTEDYYSYINASLDIVDYGFSIAGLFDQDLDIAQYTLIVRKSNDLYRHLYKKEFTQALSNSMDILEGVSIMIKEAGDTTHKKSLKLLTDVLPKLTKYGLFMANIASTDKPEEIRDILDNAILPVGSSSIKKNTDFNVSVQSYLGAYGFSNPVKSSTGNGNAWTDKFGVFAPIGISVSRGFNKGPGKNCGSLSLFAVLFDLGAIVDYQLKKDSVTNSSGATQEEITKNYKIKLGQIISPGAYVVYGFFGNIPLSLGFGAQYGPGLSKIESSGKTVFNNPQWRWNAFLAVDIPFFNLVNKSKNKKSI